MERWKARLVAQELLQTFGVDFFDTFVPVARMTSFRINLLIESMDVDVAVPNAISYEAVYISLPAGYPLVVKGLVLKHNKALYGIKLSPKGMERNSGLVPVAGAQDD